jgi:chromosome partitioning protein
LRRYVVFNQKGGVGKSTIVCNLAAVAARRGESTLVVDVDPQSNATQYLLGATAEAARPGMVELFRQALALFSLKDPPRSFVHETPFERLDVLPSHPELETLLLRLETRQRVTRLREVLGELRGYDVVFFDTPPALNAFALSALVAADRCLIPFDCDDFSRRAVERLAERLAEVRREHNPRLRLEGVVVNQFQARANFPQQAVDAIERLGLPVLAPYVSASVKVRESHHVARPLVYLEPWHKVSEEFEALYENLRRKARR